MGKTMKTRSLTIVLALFLLSLPVTTTLASNQSTGNKAASSQQQKSIIVKGIVTDQKGESIIGASILEKGTTNGTITNLDGNFTLTITSGSTLEISYIGFVTKEIKVTNATPLNIKLSEDSQALEEVVVVGYGTQKKTNLTGSVATVGAKQLEDRALTSVAAGMQGTMPGVTIKYSSGQPGLTDDDTSIRVRGTGTFNTASPMIIVDGMESTMYDIDPNDVESVSVLKDAASAAIYGSKAANGVIVITTKRGKVGKAVVNYSVNMGWQSPTRLAKYVNSADYAQLTNDARINEGLSAMYTDEDIRLFREGTDPDNHANTDWIGLLYDQSGFQQTHNLNINGGTEAMRYMISMGYQDQNGIIRHVDKNKYNIRMNLDGKISERLEASFSMAYTREDITLPTNPHSEKFSEFFRNVTKISPMVPYKYTDGTYGYIGDGNAIAWLDNNSTQKDMRNNLQAIGSLKYYILPEFSVKAMATYKYYNGETHTMRKVMQYNPNYIEGGVDKMTESNYRDDRITGDILLEYKKTFNKVHNFNVLGGYHAELYRNKSLEAYREGFPNNDLTDLDAGGTANQSTSGNTRELAMLSYFGRVTYDYMSKYLFEANVRYDGTSRFARGNRWGVFPSVSAGWRFSEEKFFEPLKSIINNAKLRLSWGKLGNQNIGGYYPTVSTLALGKNYSFGGAIRPGAYTEYAVNKNLKWEATTTYGAGLDLTFFSKLNITLDYYNKTTTGILMEVTTPMTFALSEFYDNVGKVKNKGVELSTIFHDRIGKINYNIGANIAFNKNKIISMGNVTEQQLTDANDAVYGIMRTGEAMNSFFGYKSAGYFQTEEEIKQAYPKGYNIGHTPKPGDIKYIDINHDGLLDAKDRTVLGSWDPGVTFGFNLGASYKGFDFTAAFQGATDVYGYISREGVGYINGDTAKPTTIWLNHWTTSNPNAKTPRLTIGYDGWSMPTTTSDFWMQDATYLRLKTLQIGYTLPKAWVQKAHLGNVRVYYTGENLLTLTSFMNGYDPEAPVAKDNLNGNYYPQTKTHSFGINVTF